MKSILSFAVALTISGFGMAQTSSGTAPQPVQSSPAPVEVLGLKQTSHDFGKIPQSRPVTYTFEFTNNGKDALKLENVQASCGCTTPEWSKDPIEPGATSSIKVGYNAASEGPFSKTVTIFYNGNQMKTLVISGTVYKTPATSAPANPSVSLLKQTSH